jgi:hypothetical protein
VAEAVDYRYALDHDAEIVAGFITERDQVVRFRVVLLVVYDGEERTVRLFDNAHWINEMHRYRGREKQPPETFSSASPREL